MEIRSQECSKSLRLICTSFKVPRYQNCSNAGCSLLQYHFDILVLQKLILEVKAAHDPNMTHRWHSKGLIGVRNRVSRSSLRGGIIHFTLHLVAGWLPTSMHAALGLRAITCRLTPYQGLERKPIGPSKNCFMIDYLRWVSCRDSDW